jgi:hypothetical protein
MKNFDLSGVLQIPQGCRASDVGCALKFQKNNSIPSSLLGSSLQKDPAAYPGGALQGNNQFSNQMITND